jgi:hypothetical protein
MDAVLRLQWMPLTLVFLVAGVSKLRNPASTASILRAFKLARGGLASALAWVLGIAEVAVALTIALTPPRVGGGVALATLLLMTAVLVRQLAAGRRLDCGCLGGGLPAVISWWTVARNALISIPAFLLLSTTATTFPPADAALPAAMIVSVETCALFLVAAALSMQSMVSVRSTGAAS